MSNTLFRLKRSAVKGKTPTTSNLQVGELAVNTNDGRLFFKTVDSASTQSIVTIRQIDAGTGITNTNGEISISDTGVVSGQYGTSSSIPVLTVNAQGQITAMDSVAVAGVSELSFDSASATLNISTADGGSFNARIGLSSFSTTDLAEGTNLYYTTSRIDSDLLNLRTSIIPAQDSAVDLGDFNHRFRHLYLSGNSIYIDNVRLSVDSATGQLTVNNNVDSTPVKYDLQYNTTTDLAEGDNLYYTTVRADSDARHAISVTGDRLSYNAETGVITYSETEYVGFDSDFSEKTTDQLTEGSINQYYTDARARHAVSAVDNGGDGSFSYDSVTGTFSYTGPSASETRAHFSAGTGININAGQISTTITQYTDALARGAISVTNTGGFGSIGYDNGTGIITHTNVDSSEIRTVFSAGGDLSYNGTTGEFSFTERTDGEVRGLISVTDNGGDGALSYDNNTGVISYTGPSASETRAHFSGGTGVTITNGEVAIGQSVGTTDDVTFGKINTDSAQVACLHLDKHAVAPNSLAGLLYYDSDPQKGLSFIPTTTENVQDVTINLGQETLIYVHNLTGAQINNGEAVYISGVAHGAHPQVTLAKADNASTARPIGLATQNIPDGAHGYVTKTGLVRDVNTVGMIAGGTAYLSKDSAGQWSTSEVSVDSGYPTHLGTVLTVDSAQGTILVSVEAEHFEYLRVQDKIITHDLEAPDIYSSHIHFDGKDPGYYKEGLIFYDSGNGALVVKNDEQDITLQVGQEEWIRVYNNTGSTITNGTPVHLEGINNGLPSVVSSDAVNSYGVVGVATHDIQNGSVGYVTSRGVVSDINTQNLTAGSRIHVAAGGGLTTSAVDYPYYPNDVGVCLVSDSVSGQIYVDVVDHTMETLRVTEDARFDANVTVAGNLNVIGVTTEVLSQSLTTSGNLLQLLDGDTVGTAYQNTGGLNDATFKGKYLGDSDVFYFVRMVSVDSAGVGDTIEWGISDSDQMLYGSYNGQYGYGTGFDSANGQTTWNLKDDGLTAPLREGLSIQIINLSGHDSADVWCAHPTELNLDLGMIGNYNQQNEPIKYAGVVRDATDERWKFFDAYPAENIDSSSTQFDINFDSATLSDIQFATAYGNLSGNATTATTATQLANSRNFSLTGNITSAAVGFNGTGNVSLTTSIANNVITNAMINASANIADTKLATISTSGKVQNSATTATSANTASAIVTRDVSGNFTAGTITANLTGNVTGNVTGNADTADSADNATLAHRATLAFAADSATNATTAINASYATDAGYATNAGYVSYADSAGDADTLNGQSASYYLNYNNFTNTPDITTTARNAVEINNSGTGFGSLAYNSGTGVITYNKVTKSDVRSSLQVSGDLAFDSASGTLSFSETYSTASELLTAIKTVDGSGSGLDADTLDGQQGSHYRINVYNSSGTLLN